MKKSTFLIILLLVLAVISRLILLDLRPLHHDEGVNYFFVKQIINTGTFEYNPFNYHGPFYFFLLATSFIILGISEFSLRLPSAIASITLILTILTIKTKRNFNKYLAAMFVILSPTILFYSRYSIHESLFILFSFLSIYSFTKVTEKQNLSYLPLLAISLALLFTTKETVIIMLFIIFILAIINFKQLKQIDYKSQINIILLSIILFIAVYIILFTSFFTNLAGVSDSIKSYLPWTSRGLNEPGHAKPFYYYILIILKYELPLLILSLLGIVYTLKNSKSIFARNVTIWFILSLAIYSSISYKTPWLIINVTFPMALLATIGTKLLTNKKLKFIIITLTIIYLTFFAIQLNFIKPWQSKNPLAYVHTDIDILNLIKEINKVYQLDEKILIASKDYWPLPFYLNSKNVSYLENVESININDLEDYDIFIINEKILFNADSQIPQGLDLTKKYKLRDGVGLYLVY